MTKFSTILYIFINNLKFLIDKSGKSKGNVAKDLGLKAHSNLSNYLSGTSNPDINFVIRTAKYFNVTIDNLLTSDLNENSTSNFKEPEILYEKTNTSTYIQVLQEKHINYLEKEVAFLKKEIELLTERLRRADAENAQKAS